MMERWLGAPGSMARTLSFAVTGPAGRGTAGALPAVRGGGGGSALQRRAALASTVLAGLELARDGAATLDQDQAFGKISIRPGSVVRPGVSRSDAAAA
jgi:segregation and condensation protein A